MGGLVFKAVAKSGSEPLQTHYNSLWVPHAFNIDGQNTELGSVAAGKKCVMVVNVATK